MNTQAENKSRTIRNLIIFSIIVMAIGWISHGLDVMLNNPPEQSLGMLLWIITPLSLAILFRSIGREGWADFGFKLNFKGNGRWYLFSILLYPIFTGLSLLIGKLTGWINFASASPNPILVFLQFFALGLLPAFFKNIFEEFAWRGYLFPRLYSLRLNDYLNHVVVGIVWGAWHIPYYLFFLDRVSFHVYTSQGWLTFFPMFFLGVIATAFVYDEIRLLTDSVWPLLLLHTVGNAFVNPLLLEGFIKIVPGMDAFISPGTESLLFVIIFTLIGLRLRQTRMQKEQVK